MLEQRIKKPLKKLGTKVMILEARVVLWRKKPCVVAVAGSVGKTSTQDALTTVLAHERTTRKTTDDYNSIVGAVRTVLGVPTAASDMWRWTKNILMGAVRMLHYKDYPEQLVIEAGIVAPGFMREFSFLHPEVVVYTRFPTVPAHIENFKTADEVIAEKLLLKDSLEADGTLVLNADDPVMRTLSIEKEQTLLTYGLKHDATVRGTDVEVLYEDDVPVGMTFMATYNDETAPVHIRGTLGAHHAYPLLAAITVALAEGISFKDAVQYTRTYEGPRGRMRLLEGAHESLLVDDTYNSSPEAVHAGLEAINNLTVVGKKVVVLGDMLQLGDNAKHEHEKMGIQAAAVGDVVVFVGPLMKQAYDVAKKKHERALHVDTCEEAIACVRETLGTGDLVYVKGSGGTGMERVTCGLLKDPATADSLLVRPGERFKAPYA